ncbi:outer membrane protein assembly factor BamE [Amphritea japonica]|uniref:Outer membrane protein assembly factor BamE n=1 Tax=Amphritea japonica ATCC BAA-1530 TaxID=1278309 RepID=A0A7R6P8S5_9GAMM|nr:outer membrane protein assembly factor BamE [Amphritea japonica]BBB24953.1 small protein A [Amphritea japonica ATCC BAA-1530]
MQKILISVIAAILLSGCAEFPGVYKIDIPQGNVVTQEMVDTLRPGMTQNQVRYVLGTPLITDTFSSNRWDYVYRNQYGETGTVTQQQLTVLFDDAGRLSGLAGDFRPGGQQQ